MVTELLHLPLVIHLDRGCHLAAYSYRLCIISLDNSNRSGAARSPYSRARIANKIAKTISKLYQAGFGSSPIGKCYVCSGRGQNQLTPSWELHLVTHTHTHQGYPPALGAGWPLAGCVQETRKGVGGGERGAQSGESLNLGVGEERGASKEENKCWGKVGDSRECDFTESKETGR